MGVPSGSGMVEVAVGWVSIELALVSADVDKGVEDTEGVTLIVDVIVGVSELDGRVTVINVVPI